MKNHSRRGFSRIEIALVAVLVISLASICFPAVQSVRERARTQQCAANLRQIGTALQNYHDTFQCFPAACFWERAEMVIDENSRPARNPDTVKSSRANWAQMLLPFLDPQSQLVPFDQLVTITSNSNLAARTQPFDRMNCPSDPYNSVANQYSLRDSQGNSFLFARGNYAINGGPHANAEQPGYLAFPFASGNVIKFDEHGDEFQWWGNGMAGFNKCFSRSDFTNGQSTMVAIDEIRAGIVPEDPRGVWALGQIGSSVTWAHGINSDDFGPNNQLADSDDILDGKAIVAKYGIDRFIDARMPFCAHCSYSNQATARSLHGGGVNVLMLDGTVRFVSDAIAPSLWHVMHGRDTPAEALESRFEDRLNGQIVEDKIRDSASTARSPKIVRTAENDHLQNSIGMHFKRIPAGEFTMGLPDKDNRFSYPPVAPPHPVKLGNDYFLGIYEVTQREFETVMGYNPSWHSPSGGGADLVANQETSTFPVENVSWDEAAEFCRRLTAREEEKSNQRSYRLPTEAEWEYACRSGRSEPYPLVGDWPDDDRSGEIGGKEPHPWNKTMPPLKVGSYSSNKFGLFDMRGNVFEWCDDWFLREYYSMSPVNDPTGPSHGYFKTVRGYDWTFIGTQCKDFLVTTAPWQKNRYIGFRVICLPE